ncbi:hypothetical protein OG890_39660 [Streptomyces anulatus]|uniref:hypothetical protein n=1 Tax=Streptomyces anulatus TaxID=1892 RepID=UPI00225BEE4B|nr:hypothetical protein [Streptomyces anulatus]MCX4490005.1 hypothetical protein [Streptomyces anulatus]
MVLPTTARGQITPVLALDPQEATADKKSSRVDEDEAQKNLPDESAAAGPRDDDQDDADERDGDLTRPRGAGPMPRLPPPTLALSMTRSSASRAVREELPASKVDGKTPPAAPPRAGAKALATGAGGGRRPATAECWRAPPILVDIEIRPSERLPKTSTKPPRSAAGSRHGGQPGPAA